MNDIHILMIVRKFSPFGGLELYTHKLVEGLLERNFAVSVLCDSAESSLPRSTPGFKIVELNALRGFRYSSGATRKKQEMEHLFSAYGRYLESNQFEGLIHSQHAPCPSPDVVTFHNHTARRLSEIGSSWERWINDWKLSTRDDYQCRDRYDKLLVDSAKVRVFVSRLVQEEYYRVYALPRTAPFEISYPGATLSSANLGENSAAYDNPLEDDHARILFVGKGYRKKGLDILLRACALLKRRNISFRLQIAGLRQRFLDRLRLLALGISEQVEYLGFRDDMESVFAANRIAVLPSRIEPFGMAPVQAMSYGLVPVVSKLCGVSEVLHEGQDSILLDEQLGVEELCRKLIGLIEDKDLQVRMSKNARKSASAITWERTVDSTIRAYSRIMAPCELEQ